MEQSPSISTAADTKATDGITQPTAAALARAVAPADLMIPLEIDQARKAILALGSFDKDAKQLEQEYPGIWAAVWAAIEPDLRTFVTRDYPGFWLELESLYRRRLTEKEGQALVHFYGSPTGQKLLKTYLGGIDIAPVMSDLLNSESGDLDANQLSKFTNPAKAKAVKSMGPEDEPTLLALMNSIDMVKFRTLGEETSKLTADWVNRDDPEAEAKLGKLMEAAVERHIKQHPVRK